jgi:hypothetical protein
MLICWLAEKHLTNRFLDKMVILLVGCFTMLQHDEAF